MPTFTIYTVNSDLTLLYTILNGVAMICNLNAFIWSFSLLAATWRVTSSNASIAMASLGGQSGIAPKAALGAIIPLILAMLLTNPAMKVRVHISSTSTTGTTWVDNVPVIIATIPAAGSLLSKEIGAIVETAFQGVGTDYPSISASGNGFINPLKVMLTARTALMRLSDVDSQVRTVVAACLTPGSSVDLDLAQKKIRNAGNTGAAASASDTIMIGGEYGTAMGALLFQAAQNTVGLVPDLNPNGPVVMNCPDAAIYVGNTIDTALASPEFPRVIQGAVNGFDQPLAGTNYTFTQFLTNYQAIRTANTPLTALAGGTAQSNAEAMNLLFLAMVDVNLNCLKAETTNKTLCMAAATQAMEMETHNLQAAANEVPMLKYAGSFANYLIALIIGLGPVIVLFMMFAGVDAMKNVKTVAHIMIWPLLCMNVGAELINGMIYVTISNFFTSLTQNGYLSQAVGYEAYKEFSLQIGTASHLMASLPILMSMIFALGASSSLVAVANSNNPQIKETAEQLQPRLQNAAPLLHNSSVASAQQTRNGANVTQTGALSAVAGVAGGASVSLQDRKQSAQEVHKAKEVAEAHMLSEAFSKHDAKTVSTLLGVSRSEGRNLLNQYDQRLSSDQATSHGNEVADSKVTNSGTTATAGGTVGVETPGAGGSTAPNATPAAGTPSPGQVKKSPIKLPVAASAQVGVTETAGATNTSTGTESGSERDTITQHRATSQVLGDLIAKNKLNGTNTEKAKKWEHLKTATDSFTETNSSGSRESTSAEQSLTKAIQLYGSGDMKIGEDQILLNADNREFNDFQRDSGRALAQAEFAKPYLDRAEASAPRFTTSSNPIAQTAMNRSRAMKNLMDDPKALPAERAFAYDYLSTQAGIIQDRSPYKMNAEDWENKIKGFKTPDAPETTMDKEPLEKEVRKETQPPAPKQTKNGKGPSTKKADPLDGPRPGAAEVYGSSDAYKNVARLKRQVPTDPSTNVRTLQEVKRNFTPR